MSTFNPSPSVAEQILLDLCSPDATLRDIALRASTTLDDLCLWMNLPEIAARIAAIQSAMLVKARLTAANHLPFIAHAAAELVRTFLSEERGETRADPKLRCRTREAARKAMHLLMRLARMTPHPPPSGEVPSPRGGGGSAPPSSPPSPSSLPASPPSASPSPPSPPSSPPLPTACTPSPSSPSRLAIHASKGCELPPASFVAPSPRPFVASPPASNAAPYPPP